MNLRDFSKAGHTPTLISAFLYFDISFMVWVLIGALAGSISAEFGLSPFEVGLMTAIPPLGGAVLRLILGLMTDHIGPRRTGIIGLVLTLVPLLLGWLVISSYSGVLMVGLLLGVAGASFAAALPLASRWYPPQYQGLAMGIAGAGNSGTALATFFAPRLAKWYGLGGWHNVFGLALIPVLVTLVVFVLCAKDSPNQPAPKRLADYAAVLKQRDTWWFCLFYAYTFGGFVGMAMFLSFFFQTQYQLTPVTAGTFATICVMSGSFLRPVGGFLADRFGGIRLLSVFYVGVGVLMLDLATSPPLIWGTVVIFAAMGMLGMGNGSVFQLVPQRFSKEIGVITGIVGAAGGFGGFFLPMLLGSMKRWTDSFAAGFLVFGLVGFACAIILATVSKSWVGAFIGRGGLASLSNPNPRVAGNLVTAEATS